MATSKDMLAGSAIAAAKLTDWRKLAQGLHARYLIETFADGVQFLAAVSDAGDDVGHHPRIAMGDGYLDLEVVSDDAIYREDDGTEHVVEWVTAQDVDLAKRITTIAAERGLTADPSAVAEFELGLETARESTVAPVWAALLTGNPEDQGRGTPGDEIRDATGRVPNLWFGSPDTQIESSGQRVHLEVYVAPEVVNQRIAAVVAAGGTVVGDSNSPGLTVFEDQDGNRGILCAHISAA